MKKAFAVLGLAAIAVIGAVQFATQVHAAAPPPKCIGIFCAYCPEGYVLSPTPGNCCRCVKGNS